MEVNPNTPVVPAVPSNTNLTDRQIYHAEADTECSQCKQRMTLKLGLTINDQGEGISNWPCPHCKTSNMVHWSAEAVEHIKQAAENKRKGFCCVACSLCLCGVGGGTAGAVGNLQ
eukprot:TRINITY_DN3489_c0_g1_i1.p1 TRINITY_DN3489_c0_g1~~TRINITY_DN3489_c0_g1_i1.p1  ORF type:complete len:115 (-),score=13.26 TRINITY_DN3489_c0_g1_i1:56-400(-)